MNEITKLSRDLRKNSTKAEILLWSEIRKRKLGVKIRRQHPITYKDEDKTGFFVADFACLEIMLIIEVDGKIHDKQIERDITRDYIIQYSGFKILRITNDTIINRIQDAIKMIKSEIDIKKSLMLQEVHPFSE